MPGFPAILPPICSSLRIPRIVGPFEQRGLVKLGYDLENLGGGTRPLALYLYHQYYDSARDQTVESGTAFNRTRTDISQRQGTPRNVRRTG